MISYALVCDRGHGFESWFRSFDAYDEQRAAGRLACPSCGSTSIEKAIMAPRVARKDKGAPGTPVEEAREPVALVSPEEAEFRAKLKELRAHLTQNSDYVGPRFAEEARKIHFGDADHRSIHGEATAEDARALAEEGIEFHPLPTLPEDRN